MGKGKGRNTGLGIHHRHGCALPLGLAHGQGQHGSFVDGIDTQSQNKVGVFHLAHGNGQALIQSAYGCLDFLMRVRFHEETGLGQPKRPHIRLRENWVSKLHRSDPTQRTRFPSISLSLSAAALMPSSRETSFFPTRAFEDDRNGWRNQNRSAPGHR